MIRAFSGELEGWLGSSIIKQEEQIHSPTSSRLTYPEALSCSELGVSHALHAGKVSLTPGTAPWNRFAPSISTQCHGQWAVESISSSPINIALFVPTGVLPAAEVLRELFWAAQSLLARAANVAMGAAHPSPGWPCGGLAHAAVHTEISLSPCLLPNCSVFP